ncbi:uncharacterized protein LOC132043715 [Lycium ferocissimum]|uniref:uncharacterized protein LOC132043715 n=1 Tax=Lycium ferocissimum TaxID=112874 RepID=UPI00281667F3|nr:uncharacterized protein LOC132043715 [Lycium ferocissimum]
MYRIWYKLRLLKAKLKGVNDYVASYKQRLCQARLRLEVIQSGISGQPLCQYLIDQEKATLLEIEHWSLVEEKALRQKSRASWVNYGDSNSRYFYVQWKMRACRNSITSIYNKNGTKLTDPSQVENEFINFFIKLMGESGATHPCPNSEIIKKGKCLTSEQKNYLIGEVTREEVLTAIKEMPKDKALGVDDFPIEFFTRQWHVLQEDVYEAISFFRTGKMLKAQLYSSYLGTKSICPNSCEGFSTYSMLHYFVQDHHKYRDK